MQYAGNFSNAHTLHTHINYHQIRDGNIPYTYSTYFNRSFCQSCNISYCLARKIIVRDASLVNATSFRLST